MSEALESTRAGRIAISALVVALLGTAVAGSFWPWLVQRQLFAVGLHQSWDVFAPDPIHRDVRFEALIDYADGTTSTWHVERSPARSPYASQRWELWEDHIVGDDASALWERTARWVAARHGRPGRVPVRVVLRRRWSDLPPPGLDPSLRLWNEFDFYTLDLGGGS